MRVRVAFGMALICGLAGALVAPGRGPSLAGILVGMLVGFGAGLARPHPAIITAVAFAGPLVGAYALYGSGPRPLMLVISVPLAIFVWLVHGWLWQAAQTDARDGSLVSRSDRGRVFYRIATAALVLGAVATFGARPSFGVFVMGVATFTILLLWVSDVLELRALSGWAQKATKLDHEPPVRATHVDLGVGDERWLVEVRSDHPYRAGRVGSVLLFGRTLDVIHRLSMRAFARVPLLILGGVLLATFPYERPRTPRYEPRVTEPAPTPAATGPKTERSRR